jgi:hypothetical protein
MWRFMRCGMVAAYLAQYATKSTEDTGHMSRRLTGDTIDVYANPNGTHTERLVHACWTLDGYDPGLRLSEQDARPYGRLRRWGHMLGFGGHFLTKSRRYSVTFRILREARIEWQRTENSTPEPDMAAEETIRVVNILQFAGAGWHTSGDAMLANSAAARAREYAKVAREEPADLYAQCDSASNQR